MAIAADRNSMGKYKSAKGNAYFMETGAIMAAAYIIAASWSLLYTPKDTIRIPRVLQTNSQ
jgi:hypothetical protein